MHELSAAILHMAANEGMTDLFCWESTTREGVKGWHASCKIDQRSCFVGQGIDPITAMMDAITQAWNDAPNRKGTI